MPSPARSRVVRQERLPSHQPFFLRPAPTFELVLSLQRLPSRSVPFRVDETHGATARRVPGPTAEIVDVLAPPWIAGVPRIERSVGAADDVDEMHQLARRLDADCGVVYRCRYLTKSHYSIVSRGAL